MTCQSQINRMAFCATTALGVGTLGCVYGVVASASLTARVAFGFFGIGLAGASLGSIAAWIDESSVDAETYFSNCQHHTGVAIAGMCQFVAQTMVQAVVQGVAQGVSTSIRRAIAGPDLTIEERRRGRV